MFDYKGTENFDIGKGYGEYEYDFFCIENENDFWSLMNYYGFIFKRFNYYLDGYTVEENNTGLSPIVQSKMKEYNANISLTFFFEKYTKNNIGIKQAIVNEQKPDGTFDVYSFYFYHFQELKPVDFLERGIAYANSKLHNAAIRYFSQGIMLEPEISHLYFYRAISHHVKNNIEQAVADLSKAIEITPTNSDFYSMRAFIFADIADNEKAKSDALKAIEINPGDKLAKKCLNELKG